VLDEQGTITRIVNNYARISFNFGPTLLSWLEVHAPDVYAALLEADAQSRERFGGHGSALAQSYGHTILPLANDRDRRTQVIWGLRDFEHRFGRRAEGMWLPETAADTPTLEVLAEHGMHFTVLAPRQAKRVRAGEGEEWTELDGASIDPSRPYQARLPSGRSITLFFYDGPISQGVAFEGLLNFGPAFANRLLDGFDDARRGDQLVHIATDGESYGHHHRHGEMALAAALEQIDARSDVELVNYGAFLERHPAVDEVEIVEASSWSCAHGVERWRADCGCSTGAHPGWSQAWRGPLRDALDWLRDQVAPRFERAASELLRDPWWARDRYIEVVLDRRPESRERFFAGHAARPLDAAEQTRAFELLELQRHAMLMYTSCGWFFDDISGIESVQVLHYAGRVLQLAKDLFGDDLEPGFLARLDAVRSNLPAMGTGREIYERAVRPAVIDLVKVGAHYAVSSLFEEYGERSTIYCYEVDLEDSHRLQAGRARFHVGRARMESRVTQEEARLSFAALHLGDHVLAGAVRPFRDERSYEELVRTATEAFGRADFTALLRMMDRAFGGSSYSLGSLFRDEQRKVADLVLEATLEEVERTYERLYDSHAPLLRYLRQLGTPAPRALVLPAQFIINARLRRALEGEPPDVAAMRRNVDEAKEQALQFDRGALLLSAEHAVERLADGLHRRPRDLDLLEAATGAIEILRELPFEVDLGVLQNVVYGTVRPQWAEMLAAGERGDGDARRWLELVGTLRELVRVRVP